MILCSVTWSAIFKSQVAHEARTRTKLPNELLELACNRLLLGSLFYNFPFLSSGMFVDIFYLFKSSSAQGGHFSLSWNQET